ncbi:MAG TPA: hypothetical protein ENK08_11470 [Chloroflexi bacterium]|nr:hypothetical protein [Chloroflexota bacterium]
MKNIRFIFAGVLIAGFVGALVAGCNGTPTATEPPSGYEAPASPIRTPASPLNRASPLSPLPTPLPMIEVTREPEVNQMDQESAIALAKQTLAQYLGIDEAEIKPTHVERITWPDTSLGCPEKGMMYAQVLVPGYRILLRVGEREFWVHVGNGRAVICGGEPTGTPMPDMVSTAAELYEKARSDLAHRLDVPVEEIKARSIQPTTWPDGRMGCPQPGESFPQTPTEGFVILLEHQGRTYEYHTDGERFVLCNPPQP